MNICPVCGYPGLKEPAYKRGNIPSDEICPSCGYQFGFDDDSEGITHEQWRAKWIADGMKWFDHYEDGRHPPKYWNPKEQFKNIDIFME